MSTDTPTPDGRGAPVRDAPGREVPISVDGETTLPLGRLVMGRGFITGKSGSGKSNSLGVVAEELLDRGVPALIVDTDGEHVALKEEYELLHVGASAECDVSVTENSAETIADTVLDRSVPTILDTSEFFDEDAVTELVAGVARRLFVREKSLQKPVLLVLEECHEFIPQRGNDDAKEMFTKIAKRGRKRGLGICGLSQRPADVAKAFITQCDWMAIHRLTWPNDTAVIKDVTDADHAEAVQELATGESFLVTDECDRIRRVQWRRKSTPDYGATPPVEQALGTTPDEIGCDVFAEFEDDEEPKDDAPDPLGTYTVHQNQESSQGYAQPGKPVSEYLGLTGEETVGVDFKGDHLTVSVGDGDDATYATFQRGSRDYAQFTLGGPAVAALDAEAGDTLRVAPGENDDTVRVALDDRDGAGGGEDQ